MMFLDLWYDFWTWIGGPPGVQVMRITALSGSVPSAQAMAGSLPTGRAIAGSIPTLEDLEGLR
jgi:hypothetical protein